MDTYTPAEWAAMHDKLSRMTTAEQLASKFTNLEALHRSIYPEQVVTITSNGERRILVVKALRTHLTLGLTAAVELTDRVKTGEAVEVLATRDVRDAETLTTALRNAGATVILRGRR